MAHLVNTVQELAANQLIRFAGDFGGSCKEPHNLSRWTTFVKPPILAAILSLLVSWRFF